MNTRRVREFLATNPMSINSSQNHNSLCGPHGLTFLHTKIAPQDTARTKGWLTVVQQKNFFFSLRQNVAKKSLDG
jgi:hypothetical protein